MFRNTANQLHASIVTLSPHLLTESVTGATILTENTDLQRLVNSVNKNALLTKKTRKKQTGNFCVGYAHYLIRELWCEPSNRIRRDIAEFLSLTKKRKKKKNGKLYSKRRREYLSQVFIFWLYWLVLGCLDFTADVFRFERTLDTLFSREEADRAKARNYASFVIHMISFC